MPPPASRAPPMLPRQVKAQPLRPAPATPASPARAAARARRVWLGRTKARRVRRPAPTVQQEHTLKPQERQMPPPASPAPPARLHPSEARRVMLAVATPEHTKPQPARRRARHARPEPTKTRRAAARRVVCVQPEPTKTRPAAWRVWPVRRTAALRAAGVPRWLAATAMRDSDTHWSRIHWIVVLGIKRY